eukprot:scaffold114091_cov20-Prasinocladus_malaysianus.AAC.2
MVDNRRSWSLLDGLYFTAKHTRVGNRAGLVYSTGLMTALPPAAAASLPKKCLKGYSSISGYTHARQKKQSTNNKTTR